MLSLRGASPPADGRLRYFPHLACFPPSILNVCLSHLCNFQNARPILAGLHARTLDYAYMP